MEKVDNFGDYEILTSEGWKNFTGIKKTKTQTTLKITFSDGTHIECTPKHLLRSEGKFIEARALTPEASVDDKIISEIETFSEEKNVFDVLNVEDTHHYLTNGITSHNCAFISRWSEFSASVLPTLTAGKTTKLVMVSTPKGLNHFHKLWVDAVAKINGYNPIKVTWDQVPGNDKAWYEETLKLLNYDMQKFAQEYECEFQGSSGTLVSGKKLKELVAEKPIFFDENLKKYKEPRNGKYVVVVDTSEGKGLDYSTIQVIEVTTSPYQQAATFRSNVVGAPDLALRAFNLAKMYNEAAVLIEYKNLGPQVADVMFDELEYENIICTGSNGGKGRRVIPMSGERIDKGLPISSVTKRQGCSMMKLMIEGDQLIVRDEETITELNTFSKYGNTYQAEEGKHDDLVMPLVCFGWLATTEWFKTYTESNVMVTLRELSEEQAAADMLPFGFKDDGPNEPADGEIPPEAAQFGDLWKLEELLGDFEEGINNWNDTEKSMERIGNGYDYYSRNG